jgi:hypothetical protein
MLSVVFHLDSLATDFAEAVAALAEVSPESVPVLGDMLVAALYSEKPWQVFEYRSPIANALRLGRELRYMKPDQRVVLQDTVLADPETAARLVLQGNLLETVRTKGALSGYAHKLG